MKSQQNEHQSQTKVFKCDHCDKEFNEKWKMSAHVKKHEKYECEQCDRTFKYLDIKKKHILVSHENVKLYCHFFNNERTCPFDESCIFALGNGQGHIVHTCVSHASLHVRSFSISH